MGEPGFLFKNGTDATNPSTTQMPAHRGARDVKTVLTISWILKAPKQLNAVKLAGKL